MDCNAVLKNNGKAASKVLEYLMIANPRKRNINETIMERMKKGVNRSRTW